MPAFEIRENPRCKCTERPIAVEVLNVHTGEREGLYCRLCASARLRALQDGMLREDSGRRFTW